MATYPDAALSLQNELNQILVPTSAKDPYWKYTYLGGSLEEAAEDAVANAIEYYTRLADDRACNKVTVWKILGNSGNHDSDFAMAITSGSNSYSIQLKVTVAVSSGQFTLLLYDYSTSGGPTQYTGLVALDSGVWKLIPDRPDTPQPPAPVYPDYSPGSTIEL